MESNEDNKKYHFFIGVFVFTSLLGILFYYLSEPNKNHSSVSSDSFRRAGYVMLAMLAGIGSALSFAVLALMYLATTYHNLTDKQKLLAQSVCLPIILFIVFLILRR